MVLRNLTTQQTIAGNVAAVQTWLERALGLIPRATIDPGEGLWFPNCFAVHTLGMRVPIDIIFLDRHHRVLSIKCGVLANRPLLWCRKAKAVVELGAANNTVRDILVGDRLGLE